MTNDKYKMVQDLADGWRAKYEDAKQQLVKAQWAIGAHTYWKARALDLEVERDIAVSTLEKVKVDRATAQKALAAQCEDVKKLRAELEAARADAKEAWGKLAEQCIAHTATIQKLATEQAKSAGLREVLSRLQEAGNGEDDNEFYAANSAATKILAAPSDTSALEAMIAKAGEVMRERIRIAEEQDWLNKELIRKLPAVTLEDLK